MAIVNTDKWLTTAEAAEILGVDSQSVRRYCNNFEVGRTPAIKATQVGRSWVIHPKDLEEYQKNRKSVGRPPKSAQ